MCRSDTTSGSFVHVLSFIPFYLRFQVSIFSGELTLVGAAMPNAGRSSCGLLRGGYFSYVGRSS